LLGAFATASYNISRFVSTPMSFLATYHVEQHGAHHSYPCTATMNVDPEVKEPILHIGGYIIRKEVEKALERAGTAT